MIPRSSSQNRVGIVARVVVVGERTFLPLSLQKAQAAVTAFDAEMESGKNIIEDIIALALSSVYISSSSHHRHRLVSCRTSGALVLFNPNP